MLELVDTARVASFIPFFFFFNDTATTEIYTLSLHDALPISATRRPPRRRHGAPPTPRDAGDRKSTRLNSGHVEISYAVFCLKKKNNIPTLTSFNKKESRNMHITETSRHS